MTETIQKTIFKYIFESEQFFSVVYPYLDINLFEEASNRIILEKIQEYTKDYSKAPNLGEVKFLVEQDSKIDSKVTKEVLSELQNIHEVEDSHNVDLIIKETEKWIRDETLKNAILESVEIIDKNQDRDEIYDKIKKAVSVSFRNELGLEYLKDCRSQFDFYNSEEETIKCGISSINTLMNGGWRRKSLNAFIGRTNIGKSLVLTHLAADFVRLGYNTIYISAEMSKERIYQRVDANILDMTMDTLDEGPTKKDYFKKVKQQLKTKALGRLHIKEYPPVCATKLHIQNYIKELELKKGFKPDVVIVDYLNILASCRLPASQSSDGYRYIKSIAEELRALAVEEDIVVITATQTNREGSKKDQTDFDDTATSDSFGIPMTLDSLIALIQNEELFKAGKYIMKIIKTRFGGNNRDCKTVGVKREHMRLYDLEDNEQDLPVEVKDKLAQYENKRIMAQDLDNDGDTRDFVFTEELTLGDKVDDFLED